MLQNISILAMSFMMVFTSAPAADIEYSGFVIDLVEHEEQTFDHFIQNSSDLEPATKLQNFVKQEKKPSSPYDGHEVNALPDSQMAKLEVPASLPENALSKDGAKGDKFEIAFKEGQLQLSRKSLSFDSPGGQIAVELVGFDGDERSHDFSIFIRSNEIVRWDQDASMLVAKSEGTTEIYVVSGGKMLIIPAQVSQGSKPLQVPQSLVQLDHLKTSLSGSSGASTFHSHQQTLGKSLKGAVSIADSEAQAIKTQMAEDLLAKSYVRSDEDAKVANLNLQIIEDRSRPEEGKIFAASEVSVKVVGTDYLLKSNRHGLVTLVDIPSSGRLLLQVHDPLGRYLPTLSEVYVPEDGRVVHLRVARESSFSHYAAAINVVQDMSLGSLCGRIMAKGQPLVGVSVRLSLNTSSPLYFNGGFPDKVAASTGSDGKFCYFNVQTRLGDLDVFDGEDHIGSFSLSFLAGSHIQEDFSLGYAKGVATHLASLPEAYRQLDGNDPLEKHLRIVDSVNLVGAGYNDQLAYLDEGLMGVPQGREFFKDKMLTLVNAAEFEPTLYQVNIDRPRSSVIPLVPRGFVEELYESLSQEAGNIPIAYDSSLGVMLVDFGHPKGFEGEPVDLKVLTAHGKEIDSGWYYGNSRSGTQAVFFNLEPGIYSVQALSESGSWLDVTTAVVDYETVTYSQLGRDFQIQSRPQ